MIKIPDVRASDQVDEGLMRPGTIYECHGGEMHANMRAVGIHQREYGRYLRDKQVDGDLLPGRGERIVEVTCPRRYSRSVAARWQSLRAFAERLPP
jgi:hypothetical protein